MVAGANVVAVYLVDPKTFFRQELLKPFERLKIGSLGVFTVARHGKG